VFSSPDKSQILISCSDGHIQARQSLKQHDGPTHTYDLHGGC